MTFAYPLGLLGLLAIPVLIIIYIIKSKYTEQTITSTYLWTLSERFLKRKNPINKITGIISLILQILAVILISWALAHPVFTLTGKALDYCFILDGSGSMQTVQSGESRFNAGKGRIRDMISSAADGSTFTLITTGNTTEMVMKEVTDKKTALRRLDSAEPSCVDSNLSAAAVTAQSYFNENNACRFYLITDRQVGAVQNVEVINVAGNVTNFALDDVDWSHADNGNLKVTGKAFSYERDADLTVQVFVDGANTAAASCEVSVTAGSAADFSVDWAQDNFSSIRVSIKQGDNMPLDNQVILYNPFADSSDSGNSASALIVSNQPFFIQATLGALGIETDTVKTDKFDYESVKGRYKLYVFQNFTPKSMPEEGAVWFINPDSGVDETSGFSHSGVEKLGGAAELKLSERKKLEDTLLKYVARDEVTYASEYIKLGTYRDFDTVMSCNGDPVILAGSNAYGNREVVFGIDFIESSDFAMSYNGRVLLYNLVQFTFPSLINVTKLYCGEALPVNVLANCNSIRIISPSGKAEYVSVSGTEIQYELTEVGEYTVVATIGNSRQSAKVYSQLPVAERTLNAAEPSFVIEGEPSNAGRDGIYEDLLYAFIILAVIVVADWAVYCYEQYQLR
ncbi:MAG: BatA and WFA domain-containing protein [Roseburia sp.]|nr:BatA and WFA domain-containing protein [Roseburia sp.]